VDEFLSPDARPAGPEEQKAWLDAFHAACGDTRLCLNQLLADDDSVAVHYTFEGTFQGEWLGLAPTGKRARTSGIALCRLAGGKIVEDEVNYHAESELVEG